MRYWAEFALNNWTAWYFTAVIQGSLCILGAVALTRMATLGTLATNRLWRATILLGPLLAALRIGLEHVSGAAPPAGPALLSVTGSFGWTIQGISGAALLCGLAALGVSAARGWRRRGVLGQSRPLDDGNIGESPPGVRLRECDGIRSPAAVGSQMILLPSGFFQLLPADAARAVLAHEAAHLRRRDAPWLATARALEWVFLLSPLQRLATRRLHESAEFVADDAALDAVGRPEPLVEALRTLAERSDPRLPWPAFASASLLVRRVDRVLRGPANGRRSGPVRVAALATLLLLAVWFSPGVAPACDCVFGSR